MWKKLQKNSLWTHLKTHQETKCCPICGLNVRRLREHIQSIHTPEEDKKFHYKITTKANLSYQDLCELK